MEFSEKSRNVEGRMLLNGLRDEYPTHHEFLSRERFCLAIFTHMDRLICKAQWGPGSNDISTFPSEAGAGRHIYTMEWHSFVRRPCNV